MTSSLIFRNKQAGAGCQSLRQARTCAFPGNCQFDGVSYLRDLDYSVVQQCMHCGMCLPTCPTYVETKMERNSPRGRIALMRAIADGQLEATKAFQDEMYFCLGCLACETACPAGVDYTQLFEMARAEAERTQGPRSPVRRLFRWLVLDFLFHRQGRLRFFGRLIWLYQVTGLQSLLRATVFRLGPKMWRDLQAKTPTIRRRFSPDLIAPVEKARGETRYRVGLLTGCVQDLVYSHVNLDTADVLRANGCEVVTPPSQGCCGSLHAHNGEYEWAKDYARRLLDQFDLDRLDAIITNAAGCGSHLKHFDRLLEDDPAYAAKARHWSEKVKDISEWLVEIGIAPPPHAATDRKVTYHDACHLCHGQKITAQPRELLAAIPGPLTESMWCCGSAGIYNLIQPEMADKLLQRKLDHIAATGAEIVATGNPGCLLQIENGLKARGLEIETAHPVTLLARAYRGG
jgi:glycolate oxidase iron-sulfur subunit